MIGLMLFVFGIAAIALAVIRQSDVLVAIGFVLLVMFIGYIDTL